MSDLNKLVKKLEIESLNNVDSVNTLQEILSTMTIDQDALAREKEETEKYIAEQIPEISPFFTAMVDQFEKLLLSDFTNVIQQLKCLQDELSEENYFSFCTSISNLTRSAQAFIERIMAERKRHAESIMVEDVPRLEILYELDYDLLSEESKIEDYMNYFEQTLKRFDTLFCGITFEEMKECHIQNNYARLAAYEGYFSAVVFQIYEPMFWLTHKMNQFDTLFQ